MPGVSAERCQVEFHGCAKINEVADKKIKYYSTAVAVVATSH
jgi:hypothetical protein